MRFPVSLPVPLGILPMIGDAMGSGLMLLGRGMVEAGAWLQKQGDVVISDAGRFKAIVRLVR